MHTVSGKADSRRASIGTGRGGLRSPAARLSLRLARIKRYRFAHEMWQDGGDCKNLIFQEEAGKPSGIAPPSGKWCCLIEIFRTVDGKKV